MRPISLLVSVLLLLAFPTVCLAETAQLMVEEGTPIKVKLEEALSTKTAAEGQKVQLTVVEDILGKDSKTVAIKEGTPVIGYLVSVDDKSITKGGKLIVEINSTKAVDGTKIPLHGVKTHKGKEGASAGAYVVGYALFGLLGLGVVALSNKSKESEMPAGTLLTALVDKDCTVSAVPTAIAVQMQTHEVTNNTTAVTAAAAPVKAETNVSAQVVSQPAVDSKTDTSTNEKPKTP